MTEEFDRKPGVNPASWKWGVGWMGGTPLQQQSHQTFVVNGRFGWHVDGPESAPVAAPAGRRRALAARDVAEPARIPEGGAAAWRQPGRGLAVGARRDGARRSDDGARAGHGGLHPDARQVPRGRDHQQGAHAAADPHLGAASGAGRHELRARVHERQLRGRRGRHHGSRRAGTITKAGTTTTTRRPSPPATTGSAGPSRT